MSLGDIFRAAVNIASLPADIIKDVTGLGEYKDNTAARLEEIAENLDDIPKK
jgi:hypothetical protein